MSEIGLDITDGVATVTLLAPERRNALTPGMAAELIAACEAVDADASVGTVVIAAAGESFCAGGDRDVLREVARDPADDASYAALTSVYRAFARVGELEPPSIAAVRGAAVGAGLNLALATDVRIVAQDARLVAGFLRIGLHPGGGHFALMGRAAGREAAAALSIFGEELDGQRAVEVGLAWAALPADEVEPRAQSLARRVARDPELARRAAANMRNELGPPGVSWPVALQSETATQLWSLRRALRDGRLG